MKKLKILTLRALAAFFGTTCNVDKVNAEECIYENYYIFAEINQASWYPDAIAKDVAAGKPGLLREHRTSFPSYNWGDVKDSERELVTIQLVRNNEDVTDPTKQWSLETYADKYIETRKHILLGNPDHPEINEGYKTVVEGNKIITYFLHGDWTKVEANGELEDSANTVNFSSLTKEEIKKGSILSTIDKLNIGLDNDNNQLLFGEIRRTVTQAQYDEVKGTPFTLKWSADSGEIVSLLTPAVKKATYKADCDIKTKYNVIAYHYLKGTTTEVRGPVTVEESQPTGKSGVYDCPVVDGYTLNTTDPIQYVIENADKSLYCYYTVATGSNATENVETADFLIWIAWGIGAAAIVFAIWYYVKYYRNPNNTTKKVK